MAAVGVVIMLSMTLTLSLVCGRLQTLADNYEDEEVRGFEATIDLTLPEGQVSREYAPAVLRLHPYRQELFARAGPPSPGRFTPARGRREVPSALAPPSPGAFSAPRGRRMDWYPAEKWFKLRRAMVASRKDRKASPPAGFALSRGKKESSLSDDE